MKRLCVLLLTAFMFYSAWCQVTVTELYSEYPQYGYVFYTGEDVNTQWNRVVDYIFSYYGRVIRDDISEGNGFSTIFENRVFSTYGVKIFYFDSTFTFSFRDGRFRFDITLSNCSLHDKSYTYSGAGKKCAEFYKDKLLNYLNNEVLDW